MGGKTADVDRRAIAAAAHPDPGAVAVHEDNLRRSLNGRQGRQGGASGQARQGGQGHRRGGEEADQHPSGSRRRFGARAGSPAGQGSRPTVATLRRRGQALSMTSQPASSPASGASKTPSVKSNISGVTTKEKPSPWIWLRDSTRPRRTSFGALR